MAYELKVTKRKRFQTTSLKPHFEYLIFYKKKTRKISEALNVLQVLGIENGFPLGREGEIHPVGIISLDLAAHHLG